jgi:hypothetical protein
MQYQLFGSLLAFVLLSAPATSAGGSRDTEHHVVFSFGATVDPVNTFGGGAALGFRGGTKLTRLLSIELGISYVDFSERLGTAAGAILSGALGLKLELPLFSESLRLFARGAGHYSQAVLFFGTRGRPDPRDATTGPGFVLGGGLRYRLWRDPKAGTSMFLGAELSSLWIFPRGLNMEGHTVMNTISLPVGVDW